MDKWTVIIVWWTGYLWSNVAVLFQKAWYEVALVDSLADSNESVISKINKYTGIYPDYYQIDISDKSKVEHVFRMYSKVLWVIYLTESRDVKSSIDNMFECYRENLLWMITLSQVMENFWIRNILYMSTGSIYDLEISQSPYKETDKVRPHNPYWSAKAMVEHLLKDLVNYKSFNCVICRKWIIVWTDDEWYFWDNQSLYSNILQNIYAKLNWNIDDLQISSTWWKTPDNSLIRDYVHVMDVSEWVMKWFWYMIDNIPNKWWFYEIFNIWSWKWLSEIEIINMVQSVSWKNIDYQLVDRKQLGLQSCYLDISKAGSMFWWKPINSIEHWIKQWWDYYLKNNKS